MTKNYEGYHYRIFWCIIIFQVASLYRKLEGRGYSVMVSHPKKTRHIAEAKIESDRVDSRAIAELGEVGRFAACVHA